MSEISTEQRLKLVNQIRQEHSQNRQAIHTREQILYGHIPQSNFLQGNTILQESNNYDYPITKKNELLVTQGNLPQSTFGFRIIIAAVLLVGYFFLESNKINLGILDAEVIRTEVNRYSGMEINLFDFMDNITYTFNND